MNNLPFFFNYFEEGPTDSGYEAIQDFFLSWALRCSNEIYKKDNYLVNYYSKRILYSLLYGNNSEKVLTVNFACFDKFKVLEVKTKRQVKGIDLLAQIKVQLDERIENYILNIENKWYTTLSENQLNNYAQVINQKFDLLSNKVVNVVIFCDESILSSDLSQIEKCLKDQYKFTNIDELASLAQLYEFGITGNHLFDEYWFNWPEKGV